jgi:two-component system, chemotaxis family, protein-glutamate methylesterase/glutaminase
MDFGHVSTKQPSQNPIKVLVVDDSAFMRYSISQYLGTHSELQIIGTARDGQEALELIPKLKPDVVTLDVEMPHLDGLSTLRRIMSEFPLPVIMLSSLTKEGAAETIQALTLGAVDFIAKPVDRLNIRKVMDETAAKIIYSARARIRPMPVQVLQPSAENQLSSEKRVRPRRKTEPVVVIGTSTGGPRALHEVVPALPADLEATVVVVQHMPAGFTHSLAERLNMISNLAVKEAQPGDTLDIGQVLVAPGGFHMTLDDKAQITLNQNPPVHGVRPAVDVTLTSIVQQFGTSVIAVILTGMGRDGTNGSVLLHSMGGTVIVEHESSCVVWGMPRSVVEAGAANAVYPLSEIASAIEKAVKSQLSANNSFGGSKLYGN